MVETDGIQTDPKTSATTTVIQGSEETEDTTTSATYVEAYRFSPTLDVAKYKVDFYYALTNSNGSYNVSGRLQIDDTTTISETTTDVFTDLYHGIGGTYFFNNTTPGTHNFDFDFQRGAGGTAKIRSKRVILTKVVE